LIEAVFPNGSTAFISLNKSNNMNKNIFLPRTNILPYEYPQLLAYKDAIRHSYWIDTEFNFTEDIQDFKVTISSKERDVIKKTMLAIAQIEVNVKTFWADMYKRMPITEVGDVGMTFAESEVRHKDAYARLLRILGLENEFKKVIEVPAIEKRIKYLKKYLDGTRSRDNKMYTKSVLLFSLFIEHVSLFSQFLIMMSFNKEKNLFKGISNVVEATSKEEEIHGNFGIEIINIIKKENPDWFDKEFRSLIYSACRKAYIAECGILEWVFEKGELDFLPIETIKNFIKNRFNNSLKSIGMTEIFEIDSKLLKSTEWFDIEITGTKEGDFFYKKSVDYNKKSKSITEDDLF
jgi:ribonucleoside-diphosphate reductase beta chain